MFRNRKRLLASHRGWDPGALAFARANNLNRAVIDGPNRRFGIVTAGKSYLDVMQALEDLGIDELREHPLWELCRRSGEAPENELVEVARQQSHRAVHRRKERAGADNQKNAAHGGRDVVHLLDGAQGIEQIHDGGS